MNIMNDEGLERGNLMLSQLRTHKPTLYMWRQDPLTVMKGFGFELDQNAEYAPVLRDYLVRLQVSGERAEAGAKCTWCKIRYTAVFCGTGAAAVAACFAVTVATIAAVLISGGTVAPEAVAADVAADVGCFAGLAASVGMTVTQLQVAIASAVAAVVEAGIGAGIEVFLVALAEACCHNDCA